jgi:hypothetical protein
MEESNDDEADWPITTPTARFISTSSFRPARADHYNCGVVDARHGRVLLERYRDPLSRGPLQINLIAWDPITDEQQQLPTLYPPHSQWKAAVVCAAAGSGGCDHLDCHQGPFLVLVVFMGSETMFTMIYASEANAWSEAASANPRYLHNFFETSTRGVLLGNTLYFLTHHFPEIRGILKYDMVTQEISTTDLACKFSYDVLENIVLMTTEDGRLGLATTDTCNGRLGLATTDTCKLIQLWSMEDGGGSDRVARFVHSRVIDLEKLLPASALDEGIIDVNSFADDARVLFVVSKLNRVYSIDMKSEQVKQVPGCNKWCWVFPYTSFHTPGTYSAPFSEFSLAFS